MLSEGCAGILFSHFVRRFPDTKMAQTGRSGDWFSLSSNTYSTNEGLSSSSAQTILGNSLALTG
ncbi:MAG TPA: hypothetical protein VG847_12565 [Chitinophagaceae bacterium]|nr:hypothetical protein [Chitinophagaceae bacterium]